MYFARVQNAILCLLLLSFANHACASDLLVANPKSSPESLAVTPRGAVIVGSASTPLIYKIKQGRSIAERFVDASKEGAGTFFLGVLADPSTRTLWACQLTPVSGSVPVHRKTALRGFDLETGAPKLRWNLPGENSLCNDLAIGPENAVYITDTIDAAVYRLPTGSSDAELFASDALLHGIDGITFLNGALYVTNVSSSKIYRIPIIAAKAQAPVEIMLDKPVKGPDGMRAAKGKLFVAESGAGNITAITINNDRGSTTVLKSGLETPTGVEPASNILWFTERATGLVRSITLRK